MTKTKVKTRLVPLDAARYLENDAAIAEYMSVVLEADDPDLLLLALGDVARAKGMAQVARDAGLGRESLYKALAPNAHPRFETILKLVRAFGLMFELKVAPKDVRRRAAAAIAAPKRRKATRAVAQTRRKSA